MKKILTSALASALLMSVAPSAMADDHQLSEDQQRAREIYEEIIGYRTARGHNMVPTIANSLAKRLIDAGFAADDVQVVEMDANGDPTAFLMARYPGNGSGKKPIALLGHMDVVDALPEDWERPPFTLIEEDGYFFGRGTTDNKAGITMLTNTFIRLKKEGFVPDRDMYLMFSGDEETGMITTQALAGKYAKDLGIEFALNSDAGGGGLDENNQAVGYGIQAAEKTFVTFELTATNPGGHSSRPRSDNAIYDLADALKAVQAYKFPVRSSELTRSYFATMGLEVPGETGAAMRAFARNPDDIKAAEFLRSKPEYVGTLGTTCVATMLRGGHAENALPQSATATVNCRVFPGVSIESVQQKLQTAVNNPAIQFKIMGNPTSSPASEVRPEILAAVTKSIHGRFPGLTIYPYMTSGGTDGKHFRRHGIPTVALSGLFSKPSDMFAHGLNERIQVQQFYDAVDHWYIVLKEIVGTN